MTTAEPRLRTQALVIGSGIAGCSAALALAENGVQVTLLTSGERLLSGNSPLAQGGIAYRGEGDATDLFVRDVLEAGRSCNNSEAVHHLCAHGPSMIESFLIDQLQVPFARENGGWRLTREGAHSVPRILHCADHTGLTIMEVLAKAVEAEPGIQVLTRRTAVDLLTSHHHSLRMEHQYALTNHCSGAYVFDQKSGQVQTVIADFTLLATGGTGQVFLHSTNTRGSIGSGLSMASRAGARIMDAEYIQFHPTTLYGGSSKGERRFLISEAVRGEGARLINAAGEQFMHRFDERGDLAPRDVVTRGIVEELLRTDENCVYLDATYVDEDLASRFPTIHAKCREIGVDMAGEPIPVVPAAHYHCGGVLTDLHGRTTLERLYAAGECACTGVHGSNRLASTSLLEGLVWGISSGRDIADRVALNQNLPEGLADAIPEWESPGDVQNEDPALIAQDWASIRHTMWNYVGVSRSSDRLNRAFSDLRKLTKNLHDFYRKTPVSKPLIDLFHGCRTAYTITLAALRNRKDLGCHHRVD